jgi:putative transposase
VTGVGRCEAAHCLAGRGLSPRRACVLLQLPRSTCGYQARPDADAGLAAQIDERARCPPRDGSRRVWALRRRHGQAVHKTRGPRLWRQAKLPGPKVRRKRRPARRARLPVPAAHPGPVWTDAFLYDHCLNGPTLQVWTVMDEFMREGRAIEVATSLPAPRVLVVLERLVATHGTPQFIRRENGPECIAWAVRGWRRRHQMTTRDIAPGSPWQNGYGERFNGTVREACLKMHVCHAVAQARVVLAIYRRQYHAERPHRSLNDRTPAEFKRQWLERQS